MKTSILRAALVGASLIGLAACNTANTTNFDDIISTLKQGCHVTVSFQAQAGAVNPSTGVSLQGSADCPTPIAAAAGAAGTVNAPAAAPASNATAVPVPAS